MDRNGDLLTNLYGHYVVMKTFHFQTASGFRHTKVDEYTTKYLTNMDKLMETVQGIDSRVGINRVHIDVRMVTDEEIIQELNRMILLLQKERGRAPSINAIIDIMQGDLQQLAYLLNNFQ